MSSDNRWRRLLSFIGGLITLSAIAGQLSGYFTFLGGLNAAVDNALRLIYPFSQTTIVISKIAAVIITVWGLFYVGVREYSKRYQRCSLEVWIELVKLFLCVPAANRQRELRKTKLTLFLLVPLKSLIMGIIPVWPGKRIFVVSGLQIHLWKLLEVVLYILAIVVCVLMAVFLAIKAYSALT